MIPLPYLNHKADVLRRDRDADDWDAVERAMPCLINNGSLTEQEDFRFGSRVLALFTLFCEAGRDIKTQDRIDSEGKFYRVVSVNEPGGFGNHMEAILEREDTALDER